MLVVAVVVAATVAIVVATTIVTVVTVVAGVVAVISTIVAVVLAAVVAVIVVGSSATITSPVFVVLLPLCLHIFSEVGVIMLRGAFVVLVDFMAWREGWVGAWWWFCTVLWFVMCVAVPA